MHRKRVSVLAAACAAAAALVSSPASGAEPVALCAGGAALTTSSPLPFSGSPVTTGFTVSWPDGTGCPQLSGTVTATCTSWSGRGGSATRLRHTFALNGEGGTLLVTGGLNGVIELDYSAVCNGGAARNFRGIGSLTYQG